MQYPERIIKLGEINPDIIKALKQQLNVALATANDATLWLDPDNPNFDPMMKQVVKIFQARNVDRLGHSLKQDGEIGSLTWATLFGMPSISRRDAPMPPLLAQVIAIAAGEEKKMSEKLQSIRTVALRSMLI